MTIREIVTEWLKQHGCDGLCDLQGCGCGLDDLAACESPMTECIPACLRSATEEDVFMSHGEYEIGEEIYAPAKLEEK